MNFLFRRSSSISASASRRTPAALVSLESPLLIPTHSVAPFSCVAGGCLSFFRPFPAEKIGFRSARRREFHFLALPLRFRATDVARADYAFDNYEEDKDSSKRGSDELEIAKLGISQDIVTQLANRGITKLFPMQVLRGSNCLGVWIYRAVLEPAMRGHDMIGLAKTSTGKTLAFGIPIMDNIIRFQAKNGCGRNPLAMVLVPIRELARQVEKEFRESSRLYTICVYGGSPINQQMRALNYGVDVVVGTPGRIFNLLNRGALNLSDVQFVVLDETDQMLNVGFAEDVERILEKMPQKHQTMMFSATMPTWIRKLTQRFLKDPINIDLLYCAKVQVNIQHKMHPALLLFINVGESDLKLTEGITLYSIVSDNYAKPSILGPLIKEHAKGGKCIVFTQIKHDADRLAYAVGRRFGCEVLHGDISQSQRKRTLIYIPNVDLVIHYELPNTSELFVHRSGRTGQAGKKGIAILIHSYEQNRLVRGIEQDIGCRFIEASYSFYDVKLCELLDQLTQCVIYIDLF
ncbi:unnamed protein product [Musa acuminata subsp. malaccensis]|uniref:(wild Malaysian banana) hypothetical protein n=1 Tax=Musa acuminata subsp. malaccensis TaxID=214687 RepID=A0A804JQT5_MUSAM|nr:unnamed protein product [Musa acuminata subsp. malaccensis]